ncbi:hypothetical protein ABZY58_11600 [Micromonospora tulbaghiae]|uniref:hypothetical protein n=1 Tax=Micromonospora tulbaghiae TaxID=479978 RepID=UPI0033BC3806
MIVLFLGGPLHNEHRHVQRPLPEQLPAVRCTTQFFDPADDTPVGPQPVIEHYRLRYATPAGEYAPGRRPEHPVYVHPDYNGPARW